jgi:hypothetical protein
MAMLLSEPTFWDLLGQEDSGAGIFRMSVDGRTNVTHVSRATD